MLAETYRAERQSQPENAFHPGGAALQNRRRHIQHILLERRAEARGLAASLIQGRLDFRPAEMVVHLWNVFKGAFGIADHHAVRADKRDPAAGQARKLQHLILDRRGRRP